VAVAKISFTGQRVYFPYASQRFLVTGLMSFSCPEGGDMGKLIAFIVGGVYDWLICDVVRMSVCYCRRRLTHFNQYSK